MTRQTHTASGLQKFLFDKNIFDEEHLARLEAEKNPPPPTFTEAEMEAARQEAFARGKREALEQSTKSREHLVAQVLEKMARDLGLLFQSESRREKMFETEAVQLCLAAVRKIFPRFHARLGHEELKARLESVLRRQEGHAHIDVHVTPDIVGEIETHLKHMKSAGIGLNFTVKGDETLSPGAFRLAWADGGALRSAERLAGDIETALEELLAQGGAKVHDGDKGDAA
ncbi:MAG: hypothetical protein IT558_05575 [Alphaproteobacteria bacterium]|nr:hypothetical protein [Alphaproteobacteria bacterium]